MVLLDPLSCVAVLCGDRLPQSAEQRVADAGGLPLVRVSESTKAQLAQRVQDIGPSSCRDQLREDGPDRGCLRSALPG